MPRSRPYDVTDIVPLYYRAQHLKGPYVATHRALCAALGVPENWAEDQEQRARDMREAVSEAFRTTGPAERPERGEGRYSEWMALPKEQRPVFQHSVYFARYRMRMEDMLDNSWDFGMRGMASPFSDSVDKGIGRALRALHDEAAEVDRIFFPGAYGVDPEVAISDEELVEKYGATPYDKLISDAASLM